MGTSGTTVEMTTKRFQRCYKKATIFWCLGMLEEGKKKKNNPVREDWRRKDVSGK